MTADPGTGYQKKGAAKASHSNTGRSDLYDQGAESFFITQRLYPGDLRKQHGGDGARDCRREQDAWKSHTGQNAIDGKSLFLGHTGCFKLQRDRDCLRTLQEV